MFSTICESGIFEGLLEGYLLQYFCGSFLEPRFRGIGKNRYLITCLWAGIRLLINLFFKTDIESVRIFGKLLIILAVCIAFVLLIYRKKSGYMIFLPVVFRAVGEISFLLAYTVLRAGGAFSKFWIWCMEQGHITSDELIKLVDLSMEGLIIVMYILYVVLYAVVLRSIVRSCRVKDYDIHRTECLFLMTPGAAGLLLCALLRFIMITVEQGTPRLLYDRYPVMILLVPAILILSLLSIVYSVKLFQDMISFQLEKRNRIILENQINSMQKHIEETQRIYQTVRSMKHDMKNQLSVVMRLLSRKEEIENKEQNQEGGPTENKEIKEEMQAYLEQLNQTMDMLEPGVRTGNYVVDTILNMKFHEGSSKIPDLKMDAEGLLLPGALSVQSYDLGIILGNALDNAIEACVKQKDREPSSDAFIRISSEQKGNMILIEIENSFCGILNRRKHCDLPETDKQDKEAHGIGLTNIKHAAEKYHGAIEWTAKGKVFTLVVMLQNKNRNQEG